MLELVTLGVALGEADHKVREVGGNNKGPRIRQYLENADPPIYSAAPWCAVFAQYCSDAAARGLGVENPLDEVRLEAYVQSYWEWAAPHKVIAPHNVEPGDLVLFTFGGDRWDHLGIVAQPVRGNTFWSVEGNTGTEDPRDGDGVVLKPRELDAGYGTAFVRWAP